MSSTSINSFSGLSVPFLINSCQLGEYIGSRLGSGFHLPTWIGNTGPNGGWDGIDCFEERTPSFWYLFPFCLLPLRPTLHPTVHLSSPASPPIGLLEYMLSFLLWPLFLHPSPGLRCHTLGPPPVWFISPPGQRGSRYGILYPLSHLYPTLPGAVQREGLSNSSWQERACGFSGTGYSQLGFSSPPFCSPQVAWVPCFCFLVFVTSVWEEEASGTDRGCCYCL